MMNVGDIAAAQSEKQKKDAGSFAAMVWIVSGVYIVWAYDEVQLLSMASAIFFIIGMFVAALLFGGLVFMLQRLLAKLLSAFVRPDRPVLVALTGLLAIILLLVETIAIYFAAKWTFLSLLN